MYTVVSLNVDLAGEPDTIDFTLALFFPNLLSVLSIFASCFAERLCANPRSYYALLPAMVKK